jgi:acyl carrier protein
MPEELTQRVLGTIAQAQRIPQENVTIESTFEELGIDSMDGVNILFALENEFDITIPDEAAKQILNVRQMVDGVKRIIAEKAAEKTAGVPLP